MQTLFTDLFTQSIWRAIIRSSFNYFLPFLPCFFCTWSHFLPFPQTLQFEVNRYAWKHAQRQNVRKVHVTEKELLRGLSSVMTYSHKPASTHNHTFQMLILTTHHLLHTRLVHNKKIKTHGLNVTFISIFLYLKINAYFCSWTLIYCDQCIVACCKII